MPRTVAKLILLATAVAILGGCSEEDAELLPGSTASEINANLDTVQRLSDEGDCVGAASAAQQVGEQVAALEDIDPKLKQALENGAAKLNEVVDECDEEEREVAEPTEDPAREEEVTEQDDDKDEEKDEKKAQKEAEKEEKREADEPPSSTPPPASERGPPQAPPSEAPPAQGGPPSGGVEPATPVEEDSG